MHTMVQDHKGDYEVGYWKRNVHGTYQFHALFAGVTRGTAMALVNYMNGGRGHLGHADNLSERAIGEA